MLGIGRKSKLVVKCYPGACQFSHDSERMTKRGYVVTAVNWRGECAASTTDRIKRLFADAKRMMATYQLVETLGVTDRR
jgi:hypothetical protein